MLFNKGSSQSQTDALQRMNAIQRQAGMKEINRVQGNRHVQGLVATMRASTPPPTVQPKLSVSQPGDQFEQEADRVADEVMRMPASATPPPPPGDAGDKNNKPTLSARPQALDRYVQRAPKDPVAGQPVNNNVESKISDMRRSGGDPLPDTERNFFESRMGVDLSGVKVHTDSTAVQTSRDLNARAYTVGSDVAFNSGEYQPGTPEGRRLMAHELTHVVQQGGAGNLERKVQRAQQVELPVAGPEAEEKKAEEAKSGKEEKKAGVEAKAAGTAPTAEKKVGSETKEPAEKKTDGEAKATGTAPAAEKKTDSEAKEPAEKKAGGEAKEEKAEKKEKPEEKARTAKPTLEEKKAAAPAAATPAGEKAITKARQMEKDGAGEEKVAELAEKAAGIKGKLEATLSEKGGDDKKEGAEALPGEDKKAAADPAMKALNPADDKKGQESKDELDKKAAELQALTNPQITFAEEKDAGGPATVISRAPMNEGEGPTPAELAAMRQRSQQMLSQFIGQNATRATKITATAQAAPARLTATAQQMSANIQAQIAQNQALIKNTIEQSRQRARASATNSAGLIKSDSAAAKGEIEKARDDAVKQLDTDLEQKVKELGLNGGGGILGEANKNIDAAFTTGQSAIQKVTGEIITKAKTDSSAATESVAKQYDGRKGDFFEGEDYYQKKASAARDAGAQTCNAYVAEYTKQGDDASSQLPGGKSDVVNTLTQSLNATKDKLQAEHDAAKTEIQKMATEALTKLSQTEAEKLALLNQSLQETLNSLNGVEQKLLAQSAQSGQQQQQGVVQTAQQASAQLQQAASQAAGSLTQKLNELSGQASSAPAPDPDNLQGALNAAQNQVSAATAQLEATIGNQIQVADQSLQGQMQQAAMTAALFSQQATAQVTPIDAAFTTQAQTQCQEAQKAFADIKGVVEQIKGRQEKATSTMKADFTAGKDEAKKIVDALKQGLENYANTKFKDELSGSLGKCVSEVKTKAQEAADKVQPAWKSVVSMIVSIVVSIALAVAIGLLVASGVGFFVGLLIAIGLGALAGGIKGAVDNWSKGEEWSKNLGVNMLIGGIEGGLMFAGGALVGKVGGLMKEGLKKVVVEAGIDVLAGTVTDTIVAAGQLIRDGQFTLARVGQAFVESLAVNTITKVLFLGSGPAKKLLGKIGDKIGGTKFGQFVGDVGSTVKGWAGSVSDGAGKLFGKVGGAIADSPVGKLFGKASEGLTSLKDKAFDAISTKFKNMAKDNPDGLIMKLYNKLDTARMKSPQAGDPHPWTKTPQGVSEKAAWEKGYGAPPPGYKWTGNPDKLELAPIVKNGPTTLPKLVVKDGKLYYKNGTKGLYQGVPQMPTNPVGQFFDLLKTPDAVKGAQDAFKGESIKQGVSNIPVVPGANGAQPLVPGVADNMGGSLKSKLDADQQAKDKQQTADQNKTNAQQNVPNMTDADSKFNWNDTWAQQKPPQTPQTQNVPLNPDDQTGNP